MTLDFDDAITPTYDFGFLADASPDRLQALRQLTYEYQESVQQNLSVTTDELALGQEDLAWDFGPGQFFTLQLCIRLILFCRDSICGVPEVFKSIVVRLSCVLGQQHVLVSRGYYLSLNSSIRAVVASTMLKRREYSLLDGCACY